MVPCTCDAAGLDRQQRVGDRAAGVVVRVDPERAPTSGASRARCARRPAAASRRSCRTARRRPRRLPPRRGTPRARTRGSPRSRRRSAPRRRRRCGRPPSGTRRSPTPSRGSRPAWRRAPRSRAGPTPCPRCRRRRSRSRAARPGRDRRPRLVSLRRVEPNAETTAVLRSRPRTRSKNSMSFGLLPGNPPSTKCTPRSSRRRRCAACPRRRGTCPRAGCRRAASCRRG